VPKIKKPFGWSSKWLIILKLVILKMFLTSCGEKVGIPNILGYFGNITKYWGR